MAVASFSARDMIGLLMDIKSMYAIASVKAVKYPTVIVGIPLW